MSGRVTLKYYKEGKYKYPLLFLNCWYDGGNYYVSSSRSSSSSSLGCSNQKGFGFIHLPFTCKSVEKERKKERKRNGMDTKGG